MHFCEVFLKITISRVFPFVTVSFLSWVDVMVGNCFLLTFSAHYGLEYMYNLSKRGWFRTGISFKWISCNTREIYDKFPEGLFEFWSLGKLTIQIVLLENFTSDDFFLIKQASIRLAIKNDSKVVNLIVDSVMKMMT